MAKQEVPPEVYDLLREVTNEPCELCGKPNASQVRSEFSMKIRYLCQGYPVTCVSYWREKEATIAERLKKVTTDFTATTDKLTRAFKNVSEEAERYRSEIEALQLRIFKMQLEEDE